MTQYVTSQSIIAKDVTSGKQQNFNMSIPVAFTSLYDNLSPLCILCAKNTKKKEIVSWLCIN